MNNTIVIYHGGCRDGFCAAWVVWKYFDKTRNLNYENLMLPIIQYIPAYYGQEPPDCKDKDVIIVDFAYDVNTMSRLTHTCKSLIWLDHHKTSNEVSFALDVFNNVKKVYDNSRSGAGIAWDYFFPNKLRPWLVDYIEDRDLWAKKLVDSDLVNAYVACLEFDFKVWNDVSSEPLEKAQYSGIVAQMKTEQYIREVCKNVYFVNLHDYGTNDPNERIWGNIPVINICQIDCSEILHELCELYHNSPFSLYWFKRADGMYQYGLRSIGDFDVSTVAKLFGGGGHKNAAGFQLPYLLEELK